MMEVTRLERQETRSHPLEALTGHEFFVKPLVRANEIEYERREREHTITLT